MDWNYEDDENDSGLTLKEMLLLHRIAAKWERDRWAAISARFNDKTGHNLTPEQVEWIINK